MSKAKYLRGMPITLIIVGKRDYFPEEESAAMIINAKGCLGKGSKRASRHEKSFPPVRNVSKMPGKRSQGDETAIRRCRTQFPTGTSPYALAKRRAMPIPSKATTPAPLHTGKSCSRMNFDPCTRQRRAPPPTPDAIRSSSGATPRQPGNTP